MECLVIIVFSGFKWEFRLCILNSKALGCLACILVLAFKKLQSVALHKLSVTSGTL